MLTYKNAMDHLVDFLKNHSVDSNQIFTHVSKKGVKNGLRSGRYNIPEKDLPKFFKYYQLAIINKENPVLTVGEKPGEVSPLRIDFDIKTTPDKTCSKKYDENILTSIIKVIQDGLKNLIPVDLFDNKYLICIVLEKKTSRIERDKNNNEYTKDGFHLHFPYLICEDWVQNNYIYEKLKDAKVQDLFDPYQITNKSTLIDTNMARKIWMMYGSSNVKDETSQPYMYYDKAYDHNLNKIKIKTIFAEKMVNKKNETRFYLPQFLSVRGHAATDQIPVIPALKEKYYKIHFRSKPKGVIQLRTEEEIQGDLQLIRTAKIMDMLANYRADQRNEWMEVGWTLFNIGQSSEEALRIWIDFSRRSANFDENSCYEEWSNMKMGNKTLGSLLYMAKADSPTLYEEWQKTNYKSILQKTLFFNKLAEGKLVGVIEAKYGSVFKCANYEGRTWYNFRDHRWRLCDGIQAFAAKIVSELLTDYYKLKAEIIMQQSKDVENREKLNKHVENCDKIITALNTDHFIKKVLSFSTYSSKIYDGEFEKKLDADKTLIGCENGVYDLKTGIFRDGRPDDYISMSTGIYYDPNPNQEDIDKVRNIFRKIFPNPRVNNYFWYVVSSCLDAGNLNKKIYFFVGEDGNNGKTFTFSFLEDALGEYFGTFGNDLIIKGNKPKPSEARPDLISATGKIIMTFNEIKEDHKLDISLLKLYSGGDKVGGVRDLYQKGAGKKKLQIRQDYTLLIQCNKPPRMPGDDDPLWYRIKLIPCDSRFLKETDEGYDEIPETEEEQMKKKLFKADKRLKVEVKPLAPVLLHELFQRHMYYKNNEVKDPEEVIQKTKTYRASNDMYMQFISSKIEPCAEQDTAKLTSKNIYTMFTSWYGENFAYASMVNKISRDTFDTEFGKRLKVLSKQSEPWKKCIYNESKKTWTNLKKKEIIDEDVKEAVNVFLQKK